MEIRAGGSECLIIFAFCLVPRAAPAAACGYFKCPFGSVEYGIIFQGLVPAFVMDLAARLLFANKEIKSKALIDLNFYNFLQWHGLSLVILRCNEFMLIHDLFFSPPLHWDSLHALNSKWCSGIVEKMEICVHPELDNYSAYLCCVFSVKHYAFQLTYTFCISCLLWQPRRDSVKTETECERCPVQLAVRWKKMEKTTRDPLPLV